MKASTAARTIFPFVISEYRNRKGEARVQVLMSDALAVRLATGEDDALLALSNQLEAAIGTQTWEAVEQARSYLEAGAL